MRAVPRIDPNYCCFRLRIQRSRIHRWGIYTEEDVPANRKAVEYTGEKIGPREAERRRHTPYLFVLDDYWSIDGGVGGSGAPYINHSCAPNLVTRIMKGHILYMSLRPIRKGEELTLDYNYDETDETIRCACGAPGCRGTINLKVGQARGVGPLSSARVEALEKPMTRRGNFAGGRLEDAIRLSAAIASVILA